MAFADGIRTQLASMEGVATLLESQLVTYYLKTVNNGTADSTSSTSLVGLTGTDQSIAVASGEVVLIVSWGMFSTTSAADFVQVVPYRDSTRLDFSTYQDDPAGGSGGINITMPCVYVDAPAAGTYTYQLYWATQANTAYCKRVHVAYIKLRIS
jgi:hypothetical protein